MQTFVKEIPSVNIVALREKVKEFNKRAVKLNLPPLVCTVSKKPVDVRPITFTEVFEGEAVGTFERNIKFYEVTLEGKVPVFEGWEFAGVINKEDGLNIVSGDIPAELREADARHCDHCHTNRDRKKIIVIKNVESGEYMRIGTSCVGDFLPRLSAEMLINAMSMMDRIVEIIDEAAGLTEEYKQFLSESKRDSKYNLDTVDYLAHVAYAIYKDGWVSKAKADESEMYCTADVALSYYTSPRLSLDPENVIYANFFKQAEEALDVIRNLNQEIIDNNDYLYNLKRVVDDIVIPSKRKNLAASIFVAVDNLVKSEEKKEDLAEKAAKSEYVGTVKKREDFEVEIKNIIIVDGYYGTSYMVLMEDMNGNSIVWKASDHDLHKGDKVVLKGTVKEHSVYKSRVGDVKTTYINRCKVVKVIDTDFWLNYFQMLVSEDQQDVFWSVLRIISYVTMTEI